MNEYVARGNIEKFLTLNDREIMLTGPTRTGKSLGAFQKIFRLCMTYPELRVLVARKERTSLSETGMVTFERDVLKLDNPIVVNGPRRQFRSTYQFSNNSVIVLGGLDKPGKILSSEYDIIFVQQAEEIFETDWEILITRLSGRVLPQEQQQIIGDCNPMYPEHWIFRRSKESLTLLETYHMDNPLLYNEDGTRTVYGSIYIESLEKSLTGTQRERLLKGKWVQAEGLVYENFDNETDEEPDLSAHDDGNLVHPIEIAFDDGYIDPRAILFIQRKPGYVLVFDELYHTKHLGTQCVYEIIGIMCELKGVEIPDELKKASMTELAIWCRQNKVPLPEIAVGSPEAKELHENFRLADIPVRFKPHGVVEGIKKLRNLFLDGNDYRTIRVHKRCRNFLREVTEGYRYPDKQTKRDNEKPADGNDHALDALRYWAWMRI